MTDLSYTLNQKPSRIKYPHRVELSLPWMIDYESEYEYYVKRQRWCQANIAADDWHLSTLDFCVYFAHEHDALMFMLRWQGK